LRGDLDELLGATINKAVDAATDTPDDDHIRTPALRRADALGRVCRYFLDQGESPTEDGERPHIVIAMQLETLLAGNLETSGDLALTPRRSASCSANRRSPGSSPTLRATPSTSVPPYTDPHENSDER
jgi:hypothetical protein